MCRNPPRCCCWAVDWAERGWHEGASRKRPTASSDLCRCFQFPLVTGRGADTNKPDGADLSRSAPSGSGYLTSQLPGILTRRIYDLPFKFRDAHLSILSSHVFILTCHRSDINVRPLPKEVEMRRRLKLLQSQPFLITKSLNSRNIAEIVPQCARPSFCNFR